MNAQDAGEISGPPEFDRGKARAALLSLAMIGAVLWPLQKNWQAKAHDSFPLSYYPMFSAKRDAVESFYYLVGRDQQGARHLISYKFAGAGGLNSVRRQLRKIVHEGRSAEIARKVAHRLASEDEPPWSNIVTVAVCRGDYSVDDFFHGKKDPVEEVIKASCAVKRKTQ